MSIQRWNIRVEFCGCTPSARCYEITDDNGRWVKHADHVAEVQRLQGEIAALTAKLEAAERLNADKIRDAVIAELSEDWEIYYANRIAARAVEKGLSNVR